MEIKKSFLLSFPRSGNTFTRYFVEYLTKHPTTSASTFPYDKNKKPKITDSNSLLKNIGINNVLKYEKDILIKKHNMFNSEKYIYPMIFVIRNYKEVLLRHYGDKKNAIKNIPYSDNCNYYKCLKDFNEWENNKIIIYYEDLITKTEETIKKVIKFLDKFNIKEYNNFIKNLEQHKRNSIKSYDIINHNQSSSITKGKSTIFHSKKLELSEKKEWDDLMLDACGEDLYNKYLLRYKEKK